MESPYDKKILCKESCYDISNKKLGIQGLIDNLDSRIHPYTPVQIIDISYNIDSNETIHPHKMDIFMQCISRILHENKNIVSFLFAGNNLFEKVPHPNNHHLRDYLKDLSGILMNSNVNEIDISNNNIIGHTCNQLKGIAILSRSYIFKKCTSLTCCSNNLNSNSLLFLSEGLGIFSPMTYLDLSYNNCDIDNNGLLNIQGIYELSNQISQTKRLKTLNLSYNNLCNDSIVCIFEAISKNLHIQNVDVSHNNFGLSGAIAIKNAIINHSLKVDDR